MPEPHRVSHHIRPENAPWGRICAVGLGPDGRHLIAAHMYKAAQRTHLIAWDRTTGQHHVLPEPQQGVVDRMLFLPDGRLVTVSRRSGDDPGTVRTWTPDLTPDGDPQPWRLRWWDPKRDLAVVQSRDRALEVRHIASGELLRRATTEGLWPYALDPFAASPSAGLHWAAFVLDEVNLRLLSLDRPEDPVITAVHPHPLARIRVRDQLLALVGFRDELVVRQLPNGAQTDLTTPGRDVVTESVAFTPKGHLFVAYEDGGATVWDPVSGDALATLPAPPDLHPDHSVRGPVNRVLFSHGGQRALVTHMDQHLHVGDLADSRWHVHWEETAQITAVGVCGDEIAIGNWDGDVSVVSMG